MQVEYTHVSVSDDREGVGAWASLLQGGSRLLLADAPPTAHAVAVLSSRRVPVLLFPLSPLRFISLSSVEYEELI